MSSEENLTERALRAEVALHTLAEAVDETTRLREQLARSNARVAQLSGALTPFTAYDLGASQYIDGLQQDGHPMRALKADDVESLSRSIEEARVALSTTNEISLSLAIKLGRISRHAGDLVGVEDPRDRKHDEGSITALLADPEVEAFMSKLERLALLPAENSSAR